MRNLDKIGQASIDMFGNEDNPLPALHHLKKEIEEAINKPHDTEEYADMLILLMGAFKRTGRNASELVQAAFDKIEVNKKRTWGKPDKNGVIQHIDE